MGVFAPSFGTLLFPMEKELFMAEKIATVGVTKPVTVTLTLEEWTALLARITRQRMSLLGAQIYARAADKLSEQITAGAEGDNPALGSMIEGRS